MSTGSASTVPFAPVPSESTPSAPAPFEPTPLEHRSFEPRPVILRGDHAMLEPLAREHVADLALAVQDGALWRLWFTAVPDPAGVPAYVDAALEHASAGTELPFAVRDRAGAVVGSTRYCRIDRGNRRLEIGWTWYAARAQRSALNTQAKALLLAHAFDTLGAIAVEFRTHVLNQRSRAAIERLGAKLDGVIRNDRILADGSYRDTALYSIIASEWPAVRRHLQFKLENRTGAPAAFSS